MSGMNGVPFNGEDLGGFAGSPHNDLMVRWMQVGCWVYPLYRNHCTSGAKRREPWAFTGDTYTQITDAIKQRYTLMGLWYTHSIYTLRNSRSPVVPLWYEWPEVEALHDVDREVLFADTFLVAPVLDEKATHVKITKPPGIWYSYLKGELAKDGELPVTMWDVPVYIRGGRIAPLYNTPGLTTISTIATPLTLLVAGDEHGESEGYLYLDDGLTYAYENGEFIHRRFTVKDGVLSSSKVDPFESKVPEFLQECRIVNVTVYQVQPDQSVKVRHITGLDLKLVDEWNYNLKDAMVSGSGNEDRVDEKRHRIQLVN
jgi:alpha 1,3-glucosidase